MNNLSKVLVTGADGFIGSHLTEILASKGFRVRALVQYNSFGSYGWLDNSKYLEDIEVVMGDIRDPYFVQNLVKNIDIIFHLAAQSSVLVSYKDPIDTTRTNIMGTVNILEASRVLKSLRSMIIVTTDKVYENLEKKI